MNSHKLNGINRLKGFISVDRITVYVEYTKQLFLKHFIKGMYISQTTAVFFVISVINLTLIVITVSDSLIRRIKN